jgi:hypothetical protein
VVAFRKPHQDFTMSESKTAEVAFQQEGSTNREVMRWLLAEGVLERLPAMPPAVGCTHRRSKESRMGLREAHLNPGADG